MAKAGLKSARVSSRLSSSPCERIAALGAGKVVLCTLNTKRVFQPHWRTDIYGACGAFDRCRT
jgi:hypothetical protein